MKNILIAAVMMLSLSTIACGGSLPRLPIGDPTPTPDPVATPVPPTLTANQVFQNIYQTWEFTSTCQNLNLDGSRGPVVQAHTWVNVMPVDATHTTWHYTKDQPCAYWMPDGIDAEDYFDLEQDATGAWYSTGGRIIAPHGYPWDVTHTPQDFTYSVTYDPSLPRPYLIIPAKSSGTIIVMQTTFLDVEGPNTPWETDSLTVKASTPVYTGWSMQSHQKENCVNSSGISCADEGWLFAANGIGMVKVTVYNNGSGYLAIPIVLTRIY